MILFAVLWGAFTGTMIEKQGAYCDCFRDSFKGAYCESIKGKGSEGSCHK